MMSWFKCGDFVVPKNNFNSWLESYKQSIARPLIENNEGHRVSRILGRLDTNALKAAYEAGAVNEIIGVSIKYGAQVFSLLRPNRHMHVYELLINPKYPNLGTGDEHVVEGFMTSRLDFLDREQAMKLALANGQIKVPQFNDRELFSEDLW